jgi:hypothetical protein
MTTHQPIDVLPDRNAELAPNHIDTLIATLIEGTDEH